LLHLLKLFLIENKLPGNRGIEDENTEEFELKAEQGDVESLLILGYHYLEHHKSRFGIADSGNEKKNRRSTFKN